MQRYTNAVINLFWILRLRLLCLNIDLLQHKATLIFSLIQLKQQLNHENITTERQKLPNFKL